jgi:DNA-nicking Smr family endonuclease
MGKKSNPKQGSDEDDSESSAFRSAMRDVKPLLHTPSRLDAAVPKRRARARRSSAAAVENLDAAMPLIADAAAEGESAAAALTFQRGGVRDQVMRRLRRGLYPCEDQLDLHGLNQAAARDRLVEFIAHSRNSGRRCVRIVHGKGYRSGVRGPVLKTAVNLWLRHHLDVMAFTSARAIDGGTGAVYVLLRA